MTPPPDAVTVPDAIDYIFGEIGKKAVVICLPQSARDIEALYRVDRPEYDKFMRNLAAERRENYRTKGTYY
jgi:hypothetical protein